jgi:hypothetical protein
MRSFPQYGKRRSRGRSSGGGYDVCEVRRILDAAAQKIAAYEFHEQCHVQEIGRGMQQVFDLQNDLAAKDAQIAGLTEEVEELNRK